MEKQDMINVLEQEQKRFYVLGFNYDANVLHRVIDFLKTGYCDTDTALAFIPFKEKCDEVIHCKHNCDHCVSDQVYEAYGLARDIIKIFINANKEKTV